MRQTTTAARRSLELTSPGYGSQYPKPNLTQKLGKFLPFWWGPIPAWLDEETAALVQETVNLRDFAAC
jgi:hypothetical protein